MERLCVLCDSNFIKLRQIQNKTPGNGSTITPTIVHLSTNQAQFISFLFIRFSNPIKLLTHLSSLCFPFE